MSRRTISIDELDGFELDDNGKLYWRGLGVIMEQKVSLRWIELTLAIMAAIATTVAAVWPIVVHFGLA